MTPRQLTDLLGVMLSDLLGVYKRPDGGTQPAIFLGEPPGDWNASGLEVRVRDDPSQDATALQGGEHNLAEAIPVRLTKHQTGDPARAVRRIVRKFPDATVREVPESERLGILAAKTITIPV